MRVLVTILLTGVALGTTLAQSYAQSCQHLWVERNSYYKAAGYCFETQRAIDYFGNGGCWIHGQGNVHLSPAAQRRVAQIVAQESRQGCSD
jgi:hypothetical protein